MNKNIKKIVKEKLIRLNLGKSEVFLKIRKSIVHNNNIKNSLKIYTSFNKINTASGNICKKNNICLSSGKVGGFIKGFNFSRYFIKGLIVNNKFTNIKKKNW